MVFGDCIHQDVRLSRKKCKKLVRLVQRLIFIIRRFFYFPIFLWYTFIMILHPHKIIPLLGVQHGQTILDMGSSIGYWVKPLSQIVGGSGKIIAVDNHAEIIQRLNHDTQELGLSNIDAITGDIHDLSNLPIRADSVDKLLLIRMVSVIESHLEETVTKLLGFIKEDGHVIIIDAIHYKIDVLAVLAKYQGVFHYEEINEVEERTDNHFFGITIGKMSA